MNTASCYRSYPGVVKTEIARTKNVYLFPDLNIPRTTAQYWVKQQKMTNSSNLTDIESVYKRKSEFLAEELAKEKSLRELLETVRKVFPYDFGSKELKNKQIRSQIVGAIKECIRFNKLSHCLNAIGLSKSAYQRWSSEISHCKITRLCERRKAVQLTSEEVSNMKKFVTSKKYAHISVSSLHLLAQRSGELFCAVDTWYKYIKSFEWKRPWAKVKKKYIKTGVRATRANEIWHIDVTEVNIRPGYKLFIQAVIDNFSRFVMAWQVTDRVDAQTTVETLKLAKLKATELLANESETNVMMDPGKENDNHKVLNFIMSKNLKRVLAQVDVHYSNSMIEALFRTLKNNFLYHQGINSIEDLTRKAKFYFNQHNNVIPLQKHKGGRPSEVYLSSWNEEEKQKIEEAKKLALLARKFKNTKPACENCPK